MADKSFSVAIKGFKKDTMDAVSAVFRKTALDLAKGAAQKTRVDTGLARGNWQLGVGVKPPGAVETATKAASGPVGHFIAQLSDFDPEKETPIYIINHIHYIVHLEFGTDTRSGDHMVARTVEEFLAIVLRAGGRVRAVGTTLGG
jgi:hypothetical protein